MVGKKKRLTFASVLKTAPRGGAVVARWAHNPKAGGSIPSPATKDDQMVVFFCLYKNVIVIIPHSWKYCSPLRGIDCEKMPIFATYNANRAFFCFKN